MLSLSRLFLFSWLVAGVVHAEPMRFELDTERSEVRVVLGATLHTVEGVVPVGPATFVWDADEGSASGRVVIEAGALDTGIDARNEKMHERVLRSAEFPEIIFEATGFDLRQDGEQEMRFVLEGRLTVLGTRHAVELETHARRRGDGSWKARANVDVPYVEWGLEDPSLPLFSVDKYVIVEVKAVGRLTR